MLAKRIEDIEQVIDKHFVLIKPNLIQQLKDKFEKERKRKEKAGMMLTLEEQFKERDNEQNVLRKHPALQFDTFDHTRRIRLLIENEEDLIKNDKARPDNRRGVQEVCRMTGSLTQSYFIFDSVEYKVGRKIYYGLDDENQQENDGEFIHQLVAHDRRRRDDDGGSAGESGDEMFTAEGSESSGDARKSRKSKRSKRSKSRKSAA